MAISQSDSPHQIKSFWLCAACSYDAHPTAALRAIALRPENERAMLAMNVMPMPLSVKDTHDFIRAQSDKWRPVLKSLNIRLD